MTGLLHRLAARANGTAWTVRSDARLPFGAPAWREGEAVADTSAPARSQHMPAASTMPATASPLMHEHLSAAVQPAVPAPLLAAAQATRSHTLPATPALPPPQASHQPGAHAQQPASHLPAYTAVQRPALDAAHETTTHAMHAVPPQPTTETRKTPNPLLPPVRAEPALPRTGTPLQRTTAMAQPAPARDTEVHIHIGRIDVTAVHEAPQPKARPRERAQPVSLDAYLAKRGTAG